MTPTTSFGAVEKVKGGDYDAFAALFAKYRRRLAALLRYKAGAELLAAVEVDDLLQETFLRAFRDIQRLIISARAASGTGWPPSPATSCRTPRVSRAARSAMPPKWCASVPPAIRAVPIRWIEDTHAAAVGERGRRGPLRAAGRAGAGLSRGDPAGQNRRPLHLRNRRAHGQDARSRGTAVASRPKAVSRAGGGAVMPSAPGKEELLAQALADFLDRQAREETPAIEGFCLRTSGDRRRSAAAAGDPRRDRPRCRRVRRRRRRPSREAIRL